MRPRTRSRRTGPRAAAGFTLVEVLVSSMIVVFLLISLLASFVMGRYATQVAKHRAQATNVLQARLEYLKGLGYDAVNLLPSVQVDSNVPLDTISYGIALTGTGITTITDADGDDVLEIHVQLQWEERHFGQTLNVTEELQTLLAPR